MSRTAFLVCLAVSVLAPSGGVRGQQPLPLPAGARIRLVHSCTTAGRCQRDTGTLAEAKSDTIVLQPDNGPALKSYRMAQVDAIEMARGKRSHIREGVVFGGVVGGVAGAAIGAIAMSESCVLDSDPCPLLGAFTGIGVVAPLGAAIGAVAGFFLKTDRWEVVYRERLRVSLAVQREKPGLGVSIAAGGKAR